MASYGFLAAAADDPDRGGGLFGPVVPVPADAHCSTGRSASADGTPTEVVSGRFLPHGGQPRAGHEGSGPGFHGPER